MSHNATRDLKRGEWRKFNPYNPWTEDKSEKEAQDLKVESLDDLFEEERDENTVKEVKKETKKKTPVKKEEQKQEEIQSIDSLFDDELESIPTDSTNNVSNVIQEEEEDSYDLQKELEAKFDELFGPIDSN